MKIAAPKSRYDVLMLANGMLAGGATTGGGELRVGNDVFLGLYNEARQFQSYGKPWPAMPQDRLIYTTIVGEINVVADPRIPEGLAVFVTEGDR